MLLELSAESAWADLGVVDPVQQQALESAVDPLRCFRESDPSESGLALQAIEGPVANEVFFVGASGITGGRHSASNGVVLSENYVSRRHFVVTRDRSGQYLLQDVGSTTGTFLMVREELPLDDHLVLQLGTTELTVYIEGDQCTLVATEGPDKDARATVPAQGLFVGRETSNGLCIRDPQISAFHCEVRPSPDNGYVLDDKYSTNRTWLRLAPDGQPSKRSVLTVGDLFKVGSTLFHVVDPATLLNGPAGGVEATGADAQASRSGGIPGPRPSIPPTMAATMGHVSASGVDDADPHDESGSLPSPVGVVDEMSGAGPQLIWEPFVEGEARGLLSPEEYARRVTASRRRMHAEAARREMPANQNDMRERELSSLQQRMRNSRAQTAYDMMQQRSPESRDEDLCKICYDKDIDVVLYPCGHFVLCRWCAQKVSDCPVCRFVITDVIRTYKA
jgi:pSer/pThr/pTyr-binding forkhead associated (FHA) protein